MSTDPTVAQSVDGGVMVAVYDETNDALSDSANGGLGRRNVSSADSQTHQLWADIVISTLLGEGVHRGNLEVFLVDESRMAELNVEHMGKAGSTDVLAFPIDEPIRIDDEASSVDSAFDQIERHLGDVVICPAVAEAQASGHAGSFHAEVSLLLIHGVLHVLGHDHYESAEAEVMQSRERHHMMAHGLTHPGPPDEGAYVD